MIQDKPKALFRVDAAPEIGGGHVVRCLSLATMLAGEGWRVAFASRPGTSETVPALAASGFPILNLGGRTCGEADLMRNHFEDKVDWLIVDHYRLDREFEDACRPWVKRVVAIDDLANRPHAADLLIDFTPSRDKVDYKDLAPAEATLFLGPHYAILREGFRESRRAALCRRDAVPVNRMLINMGATDPTNATGLALKAVAESGLPLDVDVILGSAAPQLDSVERTATEMAQKVTVYREVEDVAALMTSADIAIGAPGMSTWERCCLGLPSLNITTAANQASNATALEDMGAVRHLGMQSHLNPMEIAGALRELVEDTCERQRMARISAAVCDGLGARRIVMGFSPEKSRENRPIYLRPATFEDADDILEWQCHPDTRRFARNTNFPTRVDHERWMKEKLLDSNCLFNVIEYGNLPAGVLRLDEIAEAEVVSYEISILVAPDKKGLGIAQGAIRLARRLVPEARLFAFVFQENTASLALFRKVGFEETSFPNTFCAPPLLGKRT